MLKCKKVLRHHPTTQKHIVNSLPVNQGDFGLKSDFGRLFILTMEIDSKYNRNIAREYFWDTIRFWSLFS